MYEFCKKNIEGFNEVKYYKTIDSAIRDGRKKNNKLIVVKYIPVTFKEMSYIDNLDIDSNEKKVILSLFVKKKIAYEINKIQKGDKAKLSVYFNGTKRTLNEIFRISNISTKCKINDIIYSLVKKNIIESVIKGDIILSFIYDIYDFIESNGKKNIIYDIKQEDIFHKIKDFTNIGNVYDYYKRDNRIIKCARCGVLIRRKISQKRIKYCRNCAKKVLGTQKYEWKKRNKAKNKQ